MKNNLVISYLTLRKAVGIIALAFPIMLIVGALFAGFTPMQPSLSQYYWTTSGVLFVSFLITFGIFLLSYTGYDKTDEVVTSIAGVAMILVALFPCEGGTDYLFAFLSPTLTGAIHYASAIIAFISLGFMSYFQFTKSGGQMTNAKRKRNAAYRICGVVIAASILFMAPVRIIPGVFEATNVVRLFFWLESLVVWAFGVSWLIKGETLLKDKA